jgi:hypothetical protein
MREAVLGSTWFRHFNCAREVAGVVPVAVLVVGAAGVLSRAAGAA